MNCLDRDIMTPTEERLEVIETLLKWIIDERECLYDVCITTDDGIPIASGDIQKLSEYDEIINRAQAVIDKVKQEKENAVCIG